MRGGDRLFALLLFSAGAILSVAGCGGGGGNNGGIGGGGSTTISVAIFPGTATIPVSTGNTPATITFTAVVFNSTNQAVTFSSMGGGSFANNVFTAPTTPGPVTVTATSQADSSKTATVTVTVVAAQPVTVTPTALAIPAGGMQAFTATLNGAVVAAAWTLAGAAGADLGTIDANGNYTAPLTPPPGGTVSIIATSGGVGIATASIAFSNASLHGQYTFAYSGQDAGGFRAVAGTFTADGAGNITAGLEDVNTAISVSTIQFTGGTYQVGLDGRTVASFITSTGGVPFEITLSSDKHALIVRFDTVATGSGTVDLATPAEFSNTSIAGFYSFGLSGIDAGGFSEAIAGNFFADGAGTFPLNSAIQDINDAGTVTESDATLHGNIVVSVDSNTGRGTLSFTSTPASTLTFAFYIVDNTHFKLVETDVVPVLAGDAFKLNDPVTAASLGGSFAFTVGGTINIGPYAAGGVFTTNGNGSVSSGVQDENQSGQFIHLQEALSASSYSVNPANSNRLALTLTSNNNNFQYAVYPSSSGTAVMISLDTTRVDSGLAFHQSSTSSPLGSYALNLTGVASDGEQDVNGAIATASATALTGYIDVNDNGTLFPNLPLANSTITAAGAFGRGTITLQTAAPSSAMFLLAYYAIDDSTALLIELDSARVMVGVIPKRF